MHIFCGQEGGRVDSLFTYNLMFHHSVHSFLDTRRVRYDNKHLNFHFVCCLLWRKYQPS